MDASSKQKISNQKGKSSIMRGINTAIICQVATRISNPGRATYEYEYSYFFPTAKYFIYMLKVC